MPGLRSILCNTQRPFSPGPSGRAFVVALVLICCACTATRADDDAALEAFEQRVRPVLVERCHECHGAVKQEAGLRLDSRASVLRGSDNGPIVVEGRPEASLLVDAVHRRNGVEMPPDEPLSGDEIAAIEDWIRRGLPWPDSPAPVGAGDDAAARHWAFQPLVRPGVPDVQDAAWPRNEIDRFILARLEAEGLSSSAAASNQTLLRRAYFTLLGLPPAPDETAAFLDDVAPGAFQRLVDRLLASPHYGERWGRHWLDVARYADNKGYVFFEEQSYPWAYTYRDYVVESLNGDLPYDRFIREQLAADQLVSDAGVDELPLDPTLRALGFLTVGGHFMNNVHDIQDDRIDVVTRGLMGLTLSCARCHDHKYDPLTQADYYALYGVFRSTYEPLVPPLFAPPQSGEYVQFNEELQKRQAALDEFIERKHRELVTSSRERVGEYLAEVYRTKDQPSTEGFMLLNDPGDLHPSVIQRWWVHLDRARRRFDPIWSVWHEFAALPADDFAAQAEQVCARLLSRDPEEPRQNPLVVTAACDPPPQSMSELAERFARLFHHAEQQWVESLAAAEAAGVTPPVALSDSDQEELRLVLYGDDAPPNIPLATGWGFLTLLPDRPAQGEYEELLKAVEQWSMTGAGAPARAMVLLDSSEPYEPRVFIRGNAERAGDAVPRRFPVILDDSATPFASGSGRLELAERITSRDNPLTARVIVNRVWMHHFGNGLVHTPGDFGLRSEPPSLPELLDWLALEFMEHDWSLKWLHREIMASATWQQSSFSRRPSGGAAAVEQSSNNNPIDPENRLLAQRTAQRLEFEALRDALLAVSGELDPVLGGPAVDLFADPTPPRRTLYGKIDRLDMPNLLRAFDIPTPDSTSPQRDTTTVAAQSLFLMNGPWTRRAAVKLLERPEVRDESDVSRKLDQIYGIVFARSPSDAERELSLQFIGEAPTEEVWTELVQALLMSNEFAFVD